MMMMNTASDGDSAAASLPPLHLTTGATNALLQGGPLGSSLSYASSPSLSGELLRLSLSEYLRTQVAAVQQAVVLYGFNQHDYQVEDDIPIKVSESEWERRQECIYSVRAVAPHTLTFSLLPLPLLLLLSLLLFFLTLTYVQEGKLCYVCLTQSEMILLDKTNIGFVRVLLQRRRSSCAVDSN